MRIDLHCHSSVSDGTEDPATVIDRAVAAGVDVLALTDHDTVAGHADAAKRLPAGFTFVPGIELSCAYAGQSVHVLAYLFDPADPELTAELRLIRDDRVRRAREMVRLLRDAGVEVTWERVRDIARADPETRSATDVVGRPHIARALVEAGAAADVQDAFDRWVAPGRPAYVARYGLEPVRAVRLIRAAGGVSVLAHPARGEGNPSTAVPDDIVEAMARAGLDGIEADHPAHDAEECAYWAHRAAALDLVVTGSSDDHGALTGHRLGCRTTEPAAFERLVAQARGRPVVGGAA